MTDNLKFEAALKLATELGGWPAYATYMLGDGDTGDERLDECLEKLYRANEQTYLRSNQLSLMFELPFVGEE